MTTLLNHHVLLIFLFLSFLATVFIHKAKKSMRKNLGKNFMKQKVR